VNTYRPASGSGTRRLLPVVLILAAFASGCASGRTSPSESPPAQHSVTEPAGSTSSPVTDGATPNERFQSWLNGGARQGAYSLWSSGDLGGGPPAGATEKERRALFEKWLAANMDALRNAWDRTQVLHAQADLRTAMAVALTYRVDHSGFAGLTPGEAGAIEPALAFNVSESVVGEVTIRIATQGSVLLTTESRSGQVLCMAYRTDGVSYGTKDAKTLGGCHGGGWLT
jgi:hypothetical protein